MKTPKNTVGAGLLVMLSAGMTAADEAEVLTPPTIVADMDASNSGFAHGAAVAVRGDIAVVGRPVDGGTGSVGGVADVYRRVAIDATLDSVPWQWVPWCRLRPASPLAGSRFGNAVAVDGTTVVVGAWSDDRLGTNAGAAWVFELPATPQTVLTSSALLSPSGQAAGDYFGWDVTIEGDTIAVGAWGVDVNAPDDHAGAAWIFQRQGGVFQQTQRLTAGSDASAGDRFGSAVDIEDDVLLIGAPFRASESGSVYSFHQGSSTWSKVQRIDSPEGDAGEHFGAAVRMVRSESQGGTGGAGIGAPGDGELGPLAGAAWVLEHVGGGVFDASAALKVTVDGGGPWDQAGSSIDGFDHPDSTEGGGGAILMGVPGWRNPDSGQIEGAVFVAAVDDGELVEGESFRLGLFTEAGDGLGTALAADSSQVDQWGFPTVTVFVGAPGRSSGLGVAKLIDVPDDAGDGDCNDDGRFDPMEVLLEPGHDCDGDGGHDACQLLHDPWLDCDGDGQIDHCQSSEDPLLDCDADGVLDSCQISGDPGTLDCDGDGLLDACMIAANPEADCDGDGVLDSCQIASDPATFDCDGDGILDNCAIAADPGADCDGNGVLDVCESPQLEGDAWWMTEQFEAGVDLQGLGVRLEPTGNQAPPLWQLCTVMSGDVWLDPVAHTVVQLTDDDAVLHSLPFPFDFAGQTWQDVYIGSNGYLTFGTADTAFFETLADHFDRPRISGFFDDLDPSQGGRVVQGTGPNNSFVVTWINVPEFNLPETSNTLQVVLHPTGAIEMSWPSLTATTAIVGPSIGGGVPSDFVATDLSNAWDCSANSVSEGDCNGNGLPDACETEPPGDPFWGVEHFSGDFDLGDTMVRWQPTGSNEPPHWQVCSDAVSDWPVDPAGHTQVMLNDDDSMSWSIGFMFPFAGASYSTANIGSNGFVDFGGGDISHEDSLHIFFQEPRIAAFMGDLDPSAGGQIGVGNGPNGSFVVTYQDVPLYNQTTDVDMQILLHPDGAIEIAWLGGIAANGVVGVSDGMGIPFQFAQTDLSATGTTCELIQPFDDCNGNGIHDGIEIALGCELDYDPDGIPDSCQPGQGSMAAVCRSDVTGDGEVDVRDLLRVLSAWGDVKFASPNARCDLAPPKGDLRVDLADLLEVLQGMQDGCGQP
jgi:hypothetical protein